MARTSVIPHRGVDREASENTLPASGKASECGFDIELGPKRSKDGIWIVMHDLTVDCTTDGHGSVSELNWRNRRIWKALATFVGRDSATNLKRLEPRIGTSDDNSLQSVYGESIEHVLEHLERFPLY